MDVNSPKDVVAAGILVQRPGLQALPSYRLSSVRRVSLLSKIPYSPGLFVRLVDVPLDIIELVVHVGAGVLDSLIV